MGHLVGGHIWSLVVEASRPPVHFACHLFVLFAATATSHLVSYFDLLPSSLQHTNNFPMSSSTGDSQKKAEEPYDWNPNIDTVRKYFIDPMRPTATEFQSRKLELSDTISGWLACFFLMIPFFASTSFYLWKDSETPSGVGVFPKTSILTDMWTEESTKRVIK